MLKADAYGHGAVQIAQALTREGVSRYAVALVEEGVELRQGGIEGSILLMGIATPGQCELARAHSLLPAISSLDQLELWAAVAAQVDRPTEIHLKINTGMNRLGLAPDEFPEALARARREKNLVLSGLMSHFAEADVLDSPHTSAQFRRFIDLLSLLTTAEREAAEIHIANSAGYLHHDLEPTNAYRPGLALFGYDPMGTTTHLRPALSVHARIVRLHQVATGERVGYGGRWTAKRESRVGIVPLGYADGYSWRMGRRAEVLIAGGRAPLVGTVSMDMLAVDLTDLEAGVGDDVLLLGSEGHETIDAFELARHAGTPIYEVLCGLGLRLPKVFVEQERLMGVTSRFGIGDGLSGS